MTIVLPRHIEDLDGFQNDDSDESWKSHAPDFEWTAEDLEEFDREEEYERQKMEALAGWWEMEGVRCGTFGRDPQQNPYRVLADGVQLSTARRLPPNDS